MTVIAADGVSVHHGHAKWRQTCSRGRVRAVGAFLAEVRMLVHRALGGPAGEAWQRVVPVIVAVLVRCSRVLVASTVFPTPGEAQCEFQRPATGNRDADSFIVATVLLIDRVF